MSKIRVEKMSAAREKFARNKSLRRGFKQGNLRGVTAPDGLYRASRKYEGPTLRDAATAEPSLGVGMQKTAKINDHLQFQLSRCCFKHGLIFFPPTARAFTSFYFFSLPFYAYFLAFFLITAIYFYYFVTGHLLTPILPILTNYYEFMFLY
jgi:hypothetical protein